MVHLVHDFEDGMHILIGVCSVWSAVCGGPWGGWPNIEGMEGGGDWEGDKGACFSMDVCNYIQCMLNFHGILFGT